jgi:hypothetical protein
MSVPLEASECLNREYLEIRAWILQIAAALDRIDRSSGSVVDDERRRTIDEALRLALADTPGRAEQIQLLFSLVYEPAWKEKFALPARQG